MDYNFFMPTRIISGKDCVEKNSRLFSRMGKRCMIVTSGSAAKKSGALADIESALNKESVQYSIHDSVEQNPLLLDAYNAGNRAREEGAEFIIGIGGGSPLDACKVVALFATNEMDDPMQVYDRKWSNKPLPIVAIGTTAGTGSEVTQYSVMTDLEGRKRTVTTYDFFPIYSFGDYKYTTTLPLGFTISTALDALSHAVEGYFSRNANMFSDIFARETIMVLGEALNELKDIRDNGGTVSDDLRDRLYYASLNAGVTISRTGTTYCHSLGYFLTEEHHVSHGMACATFLSGYIRRAEKKVPDKAKLLEKTTGVTLKNLAVLVEDLTEKTSVKLSNEEILEIIERYDGATGLTATAPDGLSKEEATEIMTDLFA